MGKVLIILPICSLDHYRFFGILIQFPIKTSVKYADIFEKYQIKQS